MKKNIILSVIPLLLIPSSFAFSKVILEQGEDANISIYEKDNCIDGVVNIIGFENKDKNVSVNANGEVSSKLKHINWKMDGQSQEMIIEGVWTNTNDGMMHFTPNKDFSGNPSRLLYSVSGDSQCADLNGSIDLKYYSGEHYNDVTLPTGSKLDERDYIDSNDISIEVLKNDINSKNSVDIEFVKTSFDTRQRVYICDRDSVYNKYMIFAKTLDGNTTDENGFRIYATPEQIKAGEFLKDNNVSRNLERSEMASNALPVSGIWTNVDSVVNFSPADKNPGAVSVDNYRRLAHIGYISIDKDGNHGLCEIIQLSPKSILNEKINLPIHERANITVDVLDLTPEYEKAHGAVVRETLMFDKNREKLLTVSGEGSWSINNDYTVTFRPFGDFDYLHKNPSPIKVISYINNDDRFFSNAAELKIFYPTKANYDKFEVDNNQDSFILPLSNDTGDLLSDSIKLVSLDKIISENGTTYFDNSNTEHVIEKTDSENNLNLIISVDGKDAYSEEGHWKVIDKQIAFYPASGFYKKPSRIGYVVKDSNQKESFGLIDLVLGKGTVKIKAFYDLNKNGRKDSGEMFASNIELKVFDILDNISSSKTISENGETQLEIVTGSAKLTLNTFSNKYLIDRNISQQVIQITKNNLIEINVPVVKVEGNLRLSAFLDNDNNGLFSAGDTLLKNTQFKIDGENSLTILKNGEDDLIDLTTDNNGYFQSAIEYGTHIIEINGMTKSFIVSDNNLDIDLSIAFPVEVIPESNNSNSDFIKSESSVPSLSIYAIVFLFLGNSLIFIYLFRREDFLIKQQ